MGEAELLTNLAFANLNRATPDLAAAESSAESALALVPYWHYVRDIPPTTDSKSEGAQQVVIAGAGDVVNMDAARRMNLLLSRAEPVGVHVA